MFPQVLQGILSIDFQLEASESWINNFPRFVRWGDLSLELHIDSIVEFLKLT